MYISSIQQDFRSSNKNAEEGKLLIKARYKIYNEADKKGVITAAGDVMYSLTINIKDGKYRYEITKINWQQTSMFPIERWKDTASSSFNSAYPYYLKQTDEKIKEMYLTNAAGMALSIRSELNDGQMPLFDLSGNPAGIYFHPIAPGRRLGALPVEVPSSDGSGVVARYDRKQISDINIYPGLE